MSEPESTEVADEVREVDELEAIDEVRDVDELEASDELEAIEEPRDIEFAEALDVEVPEPERRRERRSTCRSIRNCWRSP